MESKQTKKRSHLSVKLKNSENGTRKEENHGAPWKDKFTGVKSLIAWVSFFVTALRALNTLDMHKHGTVILYY